MVSKEFKRQITKHICKSCKNDKAFYPKGLTIPTYRYKCTKCGLREK